MPADDLLALLVLTRTRLFVHCQTNTGEITPLLTM